MPLPDEVVEPKLAQILTKKPGVCGDFLGRDFNTWFGFDLDPKDVCVWIVQR